ncbi:MAG: AsmA family protein [Pseudomonadota bacterium]
MKKLQIVFLAFILLVAAVVLYVWLANPLNALVKTAIEKYGSEMTQATVTVGSVDLSPTDGKGVLSGLALGNPKGFKSPHALKAGRIELALEPASLTRDVVLIHKIHVDAPYISYEKNDKGVTNFDAIQRNVQRYVGAGSKAPKEDKKAETKMVIESLVIRNAKVNYNGLMDLKLPDIHLRNIGKKSGGATSAEVTRAIVGELNKQLAITLAKAAAVGAVGGVAIGVGMGIRSLLGE